MALPKTLRSGDASAPRTADGAPTPEKSPRPSLLIVDDSIDNRALLRTFLKYTRFEVEEADNGAVAVEMVKARRYDFILMDLLMPEMGGFEATRCIRQWEASQGLKPACIIALTAWALTAETLLSGATLHLTKPINKAKLLEVLNQQSLRAAV